MTQNGKKIFIVDDSPIIIARLSGMLESLGNIQSVSCAQSYAEASALLLATTPDMIILDIQLPDKNGIQLLRYIKKEYPSVIVIMLSNESGHFYRTVCEMIGADHFMDKSTEFEQIPELISSYC